MENYRILNPYSMKGLIVIIADILLRVVAPTTIARRGSSYNTYVWFGLTKLFCLIKVDFERESHFYYIP